MKPFLSFVALFALVAGCSLGGEREAKEGEWCEGSLLESVHCAPGLECDDHAGWTCRTPASYPSPPSYPAEPTTSPADDDAASSDAALVDAEPDADAAPR